MACGYNAPPSLSMRGSSCCRWLNEKQGGSKRCPPCASGSTPPLFVVVLMVEDGRRRIVVNVVVGFDSRLEEDISVDFSFGQKLGKMMRKGTDVGAASVG
ncbi:hypothetical protein NC651_032053 [Populus alba x Populus x berolinensis]|nr:hypothetical protein NC651_032053 [Populus alba x Populus x berolinensis]